MAGWFSEEGNKQNISKEHLDLAKEKDCLLPGCSQEFVEGAELCSVLVRLEGAYVLNV